MVFMKISDKKLTEFSPSQFDLCSTLADVKALQSSIIYFHTRASRKVLESSTISHSHKCVCESLAALTCVNFYNGNLSVK